jgi:hypothetical protein
MEAENNPKQISRVSLGVSNANQDRILEEKKTHIQNQTTHDGA